MWVDGLGQRIGVREQVMRRQKSRSPAVRPASGGRLQISNQAVITENFPAFPLHGALAHVGGKLVPVA